MKRRYITFIALKDYICEDLIIKIIENNTGGTKILNNLNNLINKYNLQNNCELVGLNNDIVSFFNGADLVVIPSRSEGIPNTLFEAWMAKKPVIATNVGGVSEAIDHEVNGIICEPKSDELLTAFKNFINNKNLYKDMGRNGYNTLIESFSMATMTKKLESYFQSFIK